MEIIIAHPLDPSNLREGGAIRYAWEVINILLKKNVKTTLLGVKLGKENFSHANFRFVPLVKGTDHWFFYHLALAIKLPFLRLPKNAIIHVMRPDFMFWFALYKRRNPKILTSDKPDEWMKQHHPIIYKLGGRIIRKFMEQFVMSTIDYLITDIRTVNYYIEKYPHLKSKSLFYKPFVNLELFKPMDKEKCKEKFGFKELKKIALFVGRIAPVKNLELLIKSFSIVEGKISDAWLVIVGRGEKSYESSLKSLAQRIGIKNIIFLGEINPLLIPEIINCADVLVLTSHIEGSPNVVRESIACGVPVVATDVGDVKAVITSEKLGLVVKPDPNEIANSIIFYLDAPSDFKNIIRNECMITANKWAETENEYLKLCYQLYSQRKI